MADKYTYNPNNKNSFIYLKETKLAELKPDHPAKPKTSPRSVKKLSYLQPSVTKPKKSSLRTFLMDVL